jgi:hypothetical protein
MPCGKLEQYCSDLLNPELLNSAPYSRVPGHLPQAPSLRAQLSREARKLPWVITGLAPRYVPAAQSPGALQPINLLVSRISSAKAAMPTRMA